MRRKYSRKQKQKFPTLLSRALFSGEIAEEAGWPEEDAEKRPAASGATLRSAML